VTPFTQGDPLNESDPSGELSRYSESGGLSAVGSGEGVELQNGVGLGSDAIIPPPPDTQAEQAVEAEALADQQQLARKNLNSNRRTGWKEKAAVRAVMVSHALGISFTRMTKAPTSNQDATKPGRVAPANGAGTRGPGSTHASCSAIATAVEAPYMWIPASYPPYIVSMISCQLF
jgi:hypothetical protein